MPAKYNEGGAKSLLEFVGKVIRLTGAYRPAGGKGSVVADLSSGAQVWITATVLKSNIVNGPDGKPDLAGTYTVYSYSNANGGPYAGLRNAPPGAEPTA